MVADKTVVGVGELLLTIGDRIVMRQLFPESGNLMTQLVIKDIDKKIAITQEEAKEYGIETKDNMITWSSKEDKVFRFTAAELSTLKSQVDRLDKAEKITLQMLDLCQKIKEAKTGG